MGRCFYISQPNNPTKDTWTKLELKMIISVLADDHDDDHLSESPVCRFNPSLSFHIVPVVPPRH